MPSARSVSSVPFIRAIRFLHLLMPAAAPHTVGATQMSAATVFVAFV